MNKYNFNFKIEEETEYKIEKNDLTFTKFLQRIFNNKIEEKNYYFIPNNNKIYCFDETVKDEIYNKINSFFKKNNKNISSFKIKFNIIDGNKGNEIDIFDDSVDTLSVLKELIKEIVILLKSDSPSKTECYILSLENEPIFYRIYQKL